QEPAIVHFMDDVLRAGIGMIGAGDVVEHQQDAGHRLHDEDEEEDGAEDVGPTRAARDRLIQHLRLECLESDAAVDERDDALHHRRLLACRALLLHQTILIRAFVPALNSMSMISMAPLAETRVGSTSNGRGAGPSSTLPPAS